MHKGCIQLFKYFIYFQEEFTMKEVVSTINSIGIEANKVILKGGMSITNLTKVITHAGIFHADDVCSVALLELLAGRELDVCRVNKMSDEHMIISLDRTYTIVCDIGGGRYDHHFPDEQKEHYADGVPMASIGLIAKDISIDGKTIEEVFPGFTHEILKPIEARDNGYVTVELRETPFGDIVKAFNPTWESGKSANDCFREAVDVCKVLLSRFLGRIKSRVSAADVVKNAEVINNVIILDEFVPWESHISDEIVGCVYPSNREGWCLQLAPGVLRFENRGRFEFNEYAELLTTFVHPSGFMCVTKTKEHAIELTKFITPINWKPAE